MAIALYSFLFCSNFQEKQSTQINCTMTINNEDYDESLEDLRSQKSQILIADIKRTVSCTVNPEAVNIYIRVAPLLTGTSGIKPVSHVHLKD